MQKLIKITDDHYVVVDDSNIEVDDWYIDDAKQIRKSVVSDEVYWQHRPYNREYMKITHSTRPFGGSATAISLYEVKELIGEVDVEKKANTWALENADRTMETNSALNRGFKGGYNQALEDNKDKKYTEEDIANAITFGWNLSHYHRHNTEEKLLKMQKDYIQFLQPKTEWEVEMVDGKLKLI